MLFVIAGTSGAGKGAIVSALRSRFPDLWYSISVTTRPMRAHEQDGREYTFMSREAFHDLERAGGFLESFEVYGNFYGTPAGPVDRHLAEGADVVLELDVQGALAVKDRIPDAALIFVRAPTSEEQRRRLAGRGESDETIEHRMKVDEEYEAQSARFDYIVVNDDLDQAVDEVAAILEGSRSSR